MPRVPLRMETIVTSETRRPAASLMLAVPDAPAGVEWYKKDGIHEEVRKETSQMSKVTPFLMFNDQLESAIEFYTSTFPDSKVTNVARNGKDGPINSAEFVVGGQSFMGYNGGSYFTFSEGFSLFVECEGQKEVDEYWDKLVKAGATETQCGWIKDQFGLSWQIVPKRFIELIRDRNPRKVKAVMDAMMTMVKLDVAALERAYDSVG